MSEGLGAWSTLFLLGAYHGINPGMGWLFAVARGMQEHRARAVAWSPPPIALGHALAIGAVVLIVQLAQVALPLLYIRIGVAVTLVGLGVYKLVRSRHFRWDGPTLIGRTPIGRATVAVLNVNDPEAVAIRAALIEAGLFPPT